MIGGKMNKLLKNESGGIMLIASALLVTVVSLASSISLMSMVQSDHNIVHQHHDMIQQDLLLRSEAQRTHLAIEFRPNQAIPDREVTIAGDERNTIYKIENDQEFVVISSFLGYITEQAVAVRSLVSAQRGTSFKPGAISPIRRYTERIIRNRSLSEYQYFSDVELSENLGEVKFWGPDVLHGPVHSNDDIWIQQAGGGNNNGWPTFHGKVTTHKNILHYPSGQRLAETGAPMEQIFRGEWEEGDGESLYIVFDPTATDIRNNGIHLINDPNTDILYVKINGSSYSSMRGQIILEEIRPFTVYSWFPMNQAQAQTIVNAGGNWYEEADSLWTNYVPVYDTLWTVGPAGSLNNQSAFVDCHLWIEGEVSGKQTWGASDTVKVVGDITYANTIPGEPPDGFSGYHPNTGEPQFEGPVNEFDYFGLVSEEKILLAYKHFDPFIEQRRDDNTNSIVLYGAYAAIGKGDPAIHGNMAHKHDGIFTPEYQHPHGSTPSYYGPSPYTGADTLYLWPDLQKYIFPENPFVPPNIQDFVIHGNVPGGGFPTCGYPYESAAYLNSYPNDNPNNYAAPYGTDYPWYNPVWPESQTEIPHPNVAEEFRRGTLTNYGAIAQRRRGYVHRSGNDPNNHSIEGLWDIENDHYDGRHPATGYRYKDYHYDHRFMHTQPPDYPQIYEGWGEGVLASFDKRAWRFKAPPRPGN
jgi:hypothetical protein